jgi:hypothetical protein
MNTRIVKVIYILDIRLFYLVRIFNQSKSFNYTNYLFSKKGEKTTVFRLMLS